MSIVVFLLVRMRHEQIPRLSRPEVQKAWQEWRSAAASQAETKGPVQRRIPKSVEPPGLVLLRDHFGIVLAATITFGSTLMAVLLLAVRGAMARTQRVQPPSPEGRATEDQPATEGRSTSADNRSR
ncbi:MAG: hypothetical protein GTO53_04490 [Planctomycetales bacterium]|nr:hypothetical protein [Planctomycetales bacterium]NIM08415.1 hypothetical protein [Planctomycetales bacterium]NIN07890.1 hypothetical protein [Planctomycetales bacterium]NIN77020.1 hypothetical protein [Planctomycetales bacterium]NIO34203.1 hypothetical protein [Planctomycetales bacterium]